MIETALTGAEQIDAAAELLLHRTGARAIYDVLDGVAVHHGLSDAWLVVQMPTTGPQVFRRARWSAPPATLAILASHPTGIYTDPQIPLAVSRSIAFLCEAALRTTFAEARATPRGTAPLAPVDATDEMLARACARGARYGWVATAVMLTTCGETPATLRWSALADALGTALRSGDEGGVVTPGIALALLPDAGADAVRPFLARVRAALSASGGDETDLVAAVATTPDETVDPAEMKRLALERLTAAVGTSATSTSTEDASNEEHEPVRIDAGTRWHLELDLRHIPGVICVGRAHQPLGSAHPALTVVATELSSALRAEIARVLASHDERGSVSVHSLEGAATVVVPCTTPVTGWGHDAGVSAPMNGGSGGPAPGTGSQDPEPAGTARAPAPPRLLSATAPGTVQRATLEGPSRVALTKAGFDQARQVTEVRLALGAASGTGRAPEGPLAGGAKATLTALAALGLDVPYAVVSAERVPTLPGEPVVVVLAPRSHAPGSPTGSSQRMGIAAGDDAEAASRATLGALNRGLVRRAGAS